MPRMRCQPQLQECRGPDNADRPLRMVCRPHRRWPRPSCRSNLDCTLRCNRPRSPETWQLGSKNWKSST
eukprot:2272813-Heterocapsa_arctica.AAC.1